MKPLKSSYDKFERQNIVDYIVVHNLYFELRGRLAWQKMENDNICPGRTWQSMKQHFITVIINSLDTLDLDDNEKKRILKCFHRTYAKRELEKSDYSDDDPGGITKKRRLSNENETLISKEKRVTKNENETNENTEEEEVQKADQQKEKYETQDKIESDNNRLEEIRIGNKMNEKKSNNEELNIDSSSKNINRPETNITENRNKNEITDMVISSRELDVDSNSSDRIHEEQENNSSEEEQENNSSEEEQENNSSEEEQENNSSEEEQENNVAEEEENESQISETINEEREEEPDPPEEEFSEEEDVKIIHHIQKNMDWSTVKFNDILYESCKNALTNHSALSIKNRFLNVILPKLYKYEALEISDVLLFYDRAGLEIPEEFMQLMKDSTINSENCLSEDSNKSNNVINISDSESINLEDNENKEFFSDFHVINLTIDEDEITATETDLILKPPKTIFYGEYIADQLCFNIQNEIHIFILESIVDYDLIINDLTDKYSILKTNIHTVDAERLKILTKIKTLNENLDENILKLLRTDFNNKKIYLPKTELFKSLGVPNAKDIMNSYTIENIFPIKTELENGNEDVDENLNEININNDTFSINYSMSSHSSPIISMSKRRFLKVYENKNKAKNDNEAEKINTETDIYDLSAPELFSPASNDSSNDSNPELFELDADLAKSETSEPDQSENDSEDEPLSQIKMKLIEETKAPQIFELEENNEQNKEEISHFSERQSGLLNVMKQNVLLSKKCKQIIEKNSADANLIVEKLTDFL